MPDGLSVAPITKANLMEEVWAEVARHQAGAGAVRRTLQATPHGASAGPIELPAIARALSLPELLALDGEAFVTAAYHTLLRRPADPAGIQALTEQLGAGQSKVVVLGRLRRSPEGRAVGQRLPGLTRRFVVHRAYRVPGLGRGLQIGAAVLRRLGVSRVLAGRTELGPVSLAQMQVYVDSHARLADTARETLERRLTDQQVAIDLAARRLTTLQSALEIANRRAAEVNRAFTRQLGPEGRRLTALEEQLAGTLERVQQRLGQIEAMLGTQTLAALVATEVGDLRRDVQQRMQGTEAAVSRANLAIAEQEQRLGAIAAAGGSGKALAEAAEKPRDHSLDPLYVAFEDVFRGSRDVIRQRQGVYLPILSEARAGLPDRAVVDVGCGRGEFLELLREQGLAARGVDGNVAMAELCRSLSLDVVADDAVAYLTRQDAGSLGAVTGFHIIEHLPFKTMVRLFDEALRVLAPGGLMIFETPNPANVTVSTYSFYFDPTHVRPLPEEMVAMIARARGFASTSIMPLHPMERRFEDNGTGLLAPLDQLFHGPQDYALIARKA